MLRKASAGLGVLLVASLSVSGCAPLESGGAESVGVSPDAVETPRGDDAHANAESDAAPDVSAQANAECLVGEWVVPESELQGFYDTVNVSQATFSISGDMGLTFSETEYRFSPDFALTLEIAGIDAIGEIVGEVSGSYTADEELLKTSYESSDNVEFTITVMGQVHDGKELNDTFLAMFAINESPYTCESDVLTLGYQNVDGEAVVPVVFARR